jgi:hypothetical protein
MDVVITPDKKYNNREERLMLPSWSANPGYINQEHREIFDQTKDIPGWQARGDSYKLYEMGYFAGDVILEIGIYSGKSAIVQLLGALGNQNRLLKPQYFGVDVAAPAIQRTYYTLQREGLMDYALLYRGTLQMFVKDFSIRPTMVFVDGDHSYHSVRQDLDSLSRMLRPGVPVLCHDYLHKKNDTGVYGVRKAATEWEEAGYAEFSGLFGVSALFITTAKCEGQGPCHGLAPQEFTQRKDELLRAYEITESSSPRTKATGSSINFRNESEQIQQYREQLRQQSSRLEQLATENINLKVELSLLRNSWSWKMTAPLRKTAEVLIRLKRRGKILC